jgi:hypothetical protein
MLNWRPFVAGDLGEGLAMCPECVGDELVGRDRALFAWRQLTATRSFAGAVVETDASLAGFRLVGMGAAVFVSHAFADHEIAEPQPGLNGRIIASIDAGRPVVLTDSELRSANAGGGLDLVILCAAWRKGLLDQERLSETESLLAGAFFHLFAGWRFRRMIREGANRETIAHIESQRIFGLKTCFERDRALFVSTREHALSVPGSVAAILFGYRRPVLGLGKYDQELLEVAMRGLTDEELSRTLHLKLPTVKKRWAAVFNRVALAHPGLLPGAIRQRDPRARGPQKRHLLLEYLRHHPEELRPVLPGVRRDDGRSHRVS